MFGRARAADCARMSAGPLLDRVVKLAVVASLAMVLVTPPSRLPLTPEARLHGAEWLSFETNACGHLDRVGNKRSALTLADVPFDFDDDDEWVNAWTMPPEESEMVNEWLLQHPEIGTITEAVQKECEGDEALPAEESDEPNIA